MKDIDNLSENFQLACKGKVRDIYSLESDKLLIFTSDRISAFDFTFEDHIEGKGAILTEMSKFWFHKTRHIIENHLCTTDLNLSQYLEERCMVVKKTKVLPIEAIVRGYITGSAWKEYSKNNSINDEIINKVYKKNDRLDIPIFTPSTKAMDGEKDVNIDISKMREIIGGELTDKIVKVSLDLYSFAYEYARKKGVIIADTKFEFGLDSNDKLILIDEIFTPDCSRFWLFDHDSQKINHDAFDKQFFRDYLIENEWKNEQINIPEKIKKEIMFKYRTASKLILE